MHVPLERAAELNDPQLVWQLVWQLAATSSSDERDAIHDISNFLGQSSKFGNTQDRRPRQPDSGEWSESVPSKIERSCTARTRPSLCPPTAKEDAFYVGSSKYITAPNIKGCDIIACDK